MASRIAVIGNGIVGLSIAFAVKRLDPAVDVLLYGPEDRTAHYAGSAAAPAMINVFGEVTEELYRSPHGRHLLEIGIAASDRWPAFLEAVNDELAAAGREAVALHQGTYVIPRASRAGDRTNLAAIRRALVEYDVAFEPVDDLGRVPNHRFVPGAFDPGLFIPSEKFLDARHLLLGLDWAVSSMRGVRLVRRFVHRIEADPPAVLDDAGDREGVDAIVLANSFGFSELVASLGLEGVSEIIRIFGAALRVPLKSATPAVVRTPIFGASCGDYAVYLRDHVYVGATSLAASDRVEITSHLQRNLDFFDPGRNINDCALVGGVRAMSQDLYPLIGRLTDNVWAAAGFLRSGITFAPYVSDLIAREVLGLPHGYDNRFPPFRAIREAKPTRDELARTILEELRASTSSASQQRSLDRYGWLLRLLIRRQVGQIVRGLGDDIYYNSDIVQLCYSNPAYIEVLRAAGRARSPQQSRH